MKPARFFRRSACALAGLALTAGVNAAEHRGRQFLDWSRLDDWETSVAAEGRQRVLKSPVITAGIDWQELVLSWNADVPSGAGLKFEARRLEPGPPSRFYDLGRWAFDPAGHPRESVRDQKDADGEVQTDTLVLRAPARTAQLRITITDAGDGARAELKYVGLSLAARGVQIGELPPNRAAWGRELPVPERTQVIHPEGRTAWCSPTSLAMLLAFWAEKLGRPGLNLEVPAVARGVHDPQWPGTGNWSFNVAFAGSFPGLRARVARLSDVAELEDWIAAGAPVAVSVSYNLLRGMPKDATDGHIVVVRGFTAEGDAVVNDPGTAKDIRRVFPRRQLVAAWAESGNTVYLVHPVDFAEPQDRFGHW